MKAPSPPSSDTQADASYAAILAPFATVLIWSGNAIVTKAAAGVISPSSIAFYRWALALIVLAPFATPAAWRNRHLARAVWRQLIFAGLLGMVAYQSLAYVAAETTTAVNMSIIIALMPLLSALLASLFAAESLTIGRTAGGIVSMVGLIYLISRGDPQALGKEGVHAGDAIMFVAVLANALYGVLLKRWNMALSVRDQLFWQVLAATIMLVPVWLSGTVSPITASNLPLILYAAIPTSLIAPLCWIIAIRQLGAARASLTINLLPIAVALLAWPLLGERVQSYHLVGGGIAMAGVLIGLGEWRFIRSSKSSPSESSPSENEVVIP